MDNGRIEVAVKIKAFGFFCEQDRYVEVLCSHTGDRDSRRFHSQYLADAAPAEMVIECLSHLRKEIHIDLMV